ncbi:Pyruvate kinase isozyme M1 [Heterocephalus glaber]|uniref:pyruvate kinase n=1 Tax=Heterocephalus glaber TaxID=10181 RepID=G5BHJ8_HETGA|nr:Pyruvate kinase isozyme M1 [Heterocephalus glaber]
MLKEMIKSGMNVAPLNFSHGTHWSHSETIKTVRTATESFASDPILYQPVAGALDTKGSEIQTGQRHPEVELKKGDALDSAYMDKCEENMLWLDFENICKVVDVGNKIYVDDGLNSLVENSGSLGSTKGVKLPGATMDLPNVSEKDFQDLKFGVEKPVFWVTQMLEGRIKKIRPTRAEGSNWASAVLDRADCIMLSRTKGGYPLEAVCPPGGAVPSQSSYHRCDLEWLEVARPTCTAGIFPVVCKDPVQQAWAEEVDLHVNLAMNVSKAQRFFKMGDVVIVLTGWHPGSGFTNTICVVPVP